jgi:hydroxyethylthiazole kinase
MSSTTETLSIEAAAAALSAMRSARPLVQNITNYVAMTISANVLLAVGASPAMVHAAEEAADFAAISSSLVVNIGTLSEPWVDGMRRAIGAMNEAGKPWVLDPVGCGATPYRTSISVEFAGFGPAIIRGHVSELAFSAVPGLLVGLALAVVITAAQAPAALPAVVVISGLGGLVAVIVVLFSGRRLD